MVKSLESILFKVFLDTEGILFF